MKPSQYADRISNVLFTALKAGDGEIHLNRDLAEWVHNEMWCLVDEIRQLENAVIPPSVKDMPAPTGPTVVSLDAFRAEKRKKGNLK